MFTTADELNYRCTEGLLVWYEQEMVDTAYVRITRHATKRYAYRDMDPAYAGAVEAAKVSLYTRSFAAWTLDNNTITKTYITECRSDIVRSVNDCGSVNVNINVNETDVRIVASSVFVSNPKTYFTSENARNYEDVIHGETTIGLDLYSKSKNCRVTNELSIRYRVEKDGIWYNYTRYATKTFEYFGMKQETAKNCSLAKLSQYLRQYGFVSDAGENETRIANGATIALYHGGLTWSVKVSVNETDVKRLGYSAAPATVFTAENARAYDGTSDLELTSVTMAAPIQGETTRLSTVVGSCTIPEHHLSDATFEYRVGSAVEWTEASVEWLTDTTGECRLPITEDPISCRLVCASLESDTVIATEEE